MTREEEIKNEAKLKCHDIASEVDYMSSAAYDGFIMGAEWADKTMIEKAFEWLCANMVDNTYLGANTLITLKKAEFIQKFKKAIEE